MRDVSSGASYRQIQESGVWRRRRNVELYELYADLSITSFARIHRLNGSFAENGRRTDDKKSVPNLPSWSKAQGKAKK